MRFKSGMTLLLVSGLIATGCGGDDKEKSDSASAAKPDAAQAVQADAAAKSSARTAATEMEACYVDATSYADCKPSDAAVVASDAGDAAYTLTAKSTSGNSFVIAKTATGMERTCTTAGNGGCTAGGTW